MINWLCGAPPARPPHPSAVKASVTDQHASVVSITGIAVPCKNEYGAACSVASACAENHDPPHAAPAMRGVGILIHPTLVLTTHSTIPSPLCIKDAEITFCRDVASLTYVKRKFVPEIFFETDADLDVTVVSCEIVAPELSYSLPLDTTKLHRRALRKHHPIFIMGCQVKKPDDIVIMEGCVARVHRSETLQKNAFLRFQTAGDELWMPGSAGFDEFGSFSFIVTKPLAKLQEDMQSPSFKISSEQAGTKGTTSLSDRSQASPITTHLFAHRPKQWATCVQAIKEWVEPLWKDNRNEVFEGSMPPLTQAKQMSRPSTQGDALFRQKSFTPRNSTSNESQGSHILANKKANDDEEAAFAAQQPAIVSHEMKSDQSASASITPQQRLGMIAMAPAPDLATEDHNISNQEPDTEMQETHKVPPKRIATYKQRLTKNVVFTALSKHNNGLKKLTERSLKAKKPMTESVSVQTTTPCDDEKVPTGEEVKDVKPVRLVRRTREPSEAIVKSEGKKASAGRERWSLPGELDPILMKANTKLPPIPRGAASNAKKNMQPSRLGASAWIDSYYSLGRSRSDHSIKATGSSTSSFSKAQKETLQGFDDLDSGAHGDYGLDPRISNDSQPNMQRSLSSPSSSPYTKPTISYMQRRSLAQRDQLARRASQSSSAPRWS